MIYSTQWAEQNDTKFDMNRKKSAFDQTISPRVYIMRFGVPKKYDFLILLKFAYIVDRSVVLSGAKEKVKTY